MNLFYEITPVDTLFFRGAEPLEAGQLAATGLFPPPLSVLQGALRSEVIRQKGVSFADYNSKQTNTSSVDTLIGESGSDAPFTITAVLLKRGSTLYAPAPYSWFVDTDGRLEKGQDYQGKTVLCATSRSNDPLALLCAKGSAGDLPLVPATTEARTLGGAWLRLELLSKKEPITLESGAIATAHELYATEARTGISLLDEQGRNNLLRKVKTGALYTAGHVRLADGVSLVIALDRDIGLTAGSTLPLGGEQRRSWLQKVDAISLPQSGSLFLALSAVPCTKESMQQLFCAGKPFVCAGWDLAKRFHKESQSWFAAGSVFKTNINNQCVPLAQ